VGKNFNDFVYHGQLVQANALKTAVEHWRRRKFNTAGTLFWQLNDCWPVSSWAVIDSGLRPKASYFYTKRFFAKVLITIKMNGNKVEIWGTNDLLERFNGLLQVNVLSFTEKKYLEFENEVKLKPNSSAKIFEFDYSPNITMEKYESYVAAHLLSDGYVISENRFFFAEPKHLHFPKPLLTYTISKQNETEYQIRIQTDLFAKDVKVEIEGGDADFSDNYFDLDAGDMKVIHCVVPSFGEKIEEKIMITSVQNE
jgi:beta-mannosidase